MRRLCERPGCGAPGDASYGIDQVNLVVWLDVIEVAEREMAGRLCRRHANALVVPRGWSLDDRRQPVPGLFRVVDTVPDSPDPHAEKPKTKRRPKAADVDTPSLFESIRRELEQVETSTVPVPDAEHTAQDDDDAVREVVIDPDETQAIPWSPSLARAALNVDGEKPKFGRLLGRAFGDSVDDE